MSQDLTYYWLVSNVVSLIFIMLTISPYLIVKDLRHSVHGKCVVSQQIGNIVAYFSTSVTQFLRYTYPFTPVSLEFHKYTCVIHGFVIQFVTLTTFTWMAVMNFDVWMVFSYPFTKKESKGIASFRFKFYSLFAWGLPIIILGLTWLMGFTGTFPVTFSFKPNAGHSMCFFEHSTTVWLFLYGPTAILVTTNTILLKLSGPLVHLAQEEETEKRREKENSKKDKDKKKKKKKDDDDEEEQESLGSFPMDDEEKGGDGGDGGDGGGDDEDDDSIEDQDRYYMYLKLFILNLGHLLLPIFYYPGCVWYIPVIDHVFYGIITFLILVWNDTVLDSIRPRKKGGANAAAIGRIEQVKIMPPNSLVLTKPANGEIGKLPLRDTPESVRLFADDFGNRSAPEGKTFEGMTPTSAGNLLVPPILGYSIPPIPPHMLANYAIPSKKAPLNRTAAMTSHPSLDVERMPRSQFSLDEMRLLGNPLSTVPTISSTLEDVQLPQSYPVIPQHQQQPLPPPPPPQQVNLEQSNKNSSLANLPIPDSLTLSGLGTIESTAALKTFQESDDGEEALT